MEQRALFIMPTERIYDLCQTEKGATFIEKNET